MVGICRLVENLFQFGSQNSQRHLLNTVGFHWLIEFALQDCQLLAQDKNFQILLLL